MSVVAELKRRNVVRMGVLYGLAAWLILQVADVLAPALGLPDWVMRLVALLLLLGFPLVLIFSWVYELTPEGLKKQHEVDRNQSITHETGRKINFLIGTLAVLAIVVVAAERFIPRTAPIPVATEAAPPAEAPVEAVAKSIAVLPFADMSAGKDQEYFADGLSEELLNLLAKLPELRVIGRTSSFQFKGQNEDLRVIGETLNVAHILEGSVRKSGNKVRITAQLIRAEDGSHVWSQSYDRTLDDIFVVQDDIAGEVVKALRISLLGEVPKAGEIKPEAYALYLQGIHFNYQGTEEGFEKAESAFQAALKLEPEYAPAWDWLGRVYLIQAGQYRDVHEGNALAHDAVERALALDPNRAAAHATMGWIRIYADWDWQGADEAMERALALEPGNAESLIGTADIASLMGRIDVAIELNQRVVELDPLNIYAHVRLGALFQFAGRLEEAAARFRYSIDLDPQFPAVHSLLGYNFLLQNEPQMALAEMERETEPTVREFGSVLALFSLGRTAEADRALAVLIESHGDSWATAVAEVYAWRDDADQAFRWLETAYEQRDGYLAQVAFNPRLAKLKSDPRWPAFLDKMGLPH